ncbi:MAG: ATP-binding protein [bacterium]
MHLTVPLWSLPGLYNAVVALVVGIVVIFQNPKARTNQLLHFFSLAIAFWAVAYFFWMESPDPQKALLWAKILTAGSVFIYPLHLHWTAEISETKVKKSLIAFNYIFAAIFALMVFTPYMVASVAPRYGFKFWPVAGPLYYFHLLWVGTNAATLLFILYKAVRRSRGHKGLQMRIILWGSLVGYIGGFTNYPLWLNIPVAPVGTALVSAFPLAFSYAVIKHRFLDIRVALRAVLMRFLMAVFLMIIVYNIIGIYFNIGVEPISAGFVLVAALTSIFVVLIYEPLLHIVQQTADKTIFRNEKTREEMLRKIGKELSGNLDLDKLLKFVQQAVCEILNVKKVGFVLRVNHYTKSTRIIEWGFEDWINCEWSQCKEVFDHIEKTSAILVLDEVRFEAKNTKDEVFKKKMLGIARAMERNRVAVAAPLPTSDGLLGIMVLGERENKHAFTITDIETIQAVSYQAAVAIQNAYLYSELQKFNQKLEVRVRKATRRLRSAHKKLTRQYQELETLDKMKDELIAVASHELKTPMTSIKGHLWLVLNKMKNSITSPRARESLEEAYSSSNNMIKLVDDILTVSQIEGRKIRINAKPQSIEPIIDNVVSELEVLAVRKHITIVVEKPQTELPPVRIDEMRVREVLTNLLGNAVKFSPKRGSIKLKVTVPKLKGFIEIAVSDSGPGIAPDDIPRLFKKFGRLDGSYTAAAETGGTGLGLYICKTVVEMHGGSIGVKSNAGRGSTFAFTLPIAK